jgi:NitT/TauT family transport system ATP-binding protein
MTPSKTKKAAKETLPKKSWWTKLKNLVVEPATAPKKCVDEKDVEKNQTGDPAKVEAAPTPAKEDPTAIAAEDQSSPTAVGSLATTPTSAEVAAPSAPGTPAPLPIVVKFANVTKSFGHGRASQIALQDINFTVEDLPDTGELISIVGPSGCGKSTLLRMIAGLEPHYPQTGGTIEILGRSGNLLPDWKRGLVDQKYSLFPHLTVRGNVMFGLDIRGESRSTREDKADIWIKKVGLEGNADKYPQELSGGMQQRVAIAATLVLGPRILLMDEPFGALDPKTRLRMQELLVQLWNEQESTVFIVTHSVEEALYLGDRVFRMGAKPGRLLEILQAPRPEIPPEEMRQKKWFIEMARDLLNRLEQDKLAIGELSSYSEFVTEHNSHHPKMMR